jgi:fucose 4-O-acetylase-like acetyltransferase
MADVKSLLAAIKDTKPMDLVNHPFTFAAGVGLANGLLAAARGKHIDLKTAAALTMILGVGETVIVAFEPGEKKHSNLAVLLHSIAGVGLGLAPFVRMSSDEKELVGKTIPIAKGVSEKGEAVA